MGEFREVAVSILFLLAAGTWLFIVPGLALQGGLANAPLSGPRTHDSDAYLTWAAWLGAGLPLAGVVAAAIMRRRRWTWFFGIALALAAGVAALKWADDLRHAPPPPEPPHCGQHSGAGSECPGG